MLSIRKSKWVFDTSATYEFGLGLLSTSGGKIVINDPQGESHNFRYSGFGLGVSAAISKIKLPPLPALNRTVSVTGSTENFDSRGWLYMTDSFPGDELARSDIQGGAIYLDCGAGLLAGYGGTFMFLGINVALLTPWLVNPGLFANLASNVIKSAPAFLFMHGVSEQSTQLKRA